MNEILYRLLFGLSDANSAVILCGPAMAFIPAILSIATFAMSAFSKGPKEPKAVQAPNAGQVANANVALNRKNARAADYASTRLSTPTLGGTNYLTDLAMAQGLKTNLGG